MDVANHLILHSGYTKTNLQVMKMTYIAHGHMMAIYNEPLIYDEVEAWDHGPVIPAIWKEFRKWGSSVIGRVKYIPDPFKNKEREVIDGTFQHYGKFCGYYLSQITHHDGDRRTPWSMYYQKGKNQVIPDDVTKNYYRELIR